MIAWLRIAFVAVAITGLTAVLAPIQLAGLALDLRLRRRIPRVWHRVVVSLIGLRITVHGEVDSRRPLLIAANHASWQDIMVLGAIADVVFIAKSDVRRWPVFGALAKMQKCIFVEREQKRRTGDQVNEIAARLIDGEIVVLFPEGTTSDGNRMLEVKSSLFGAAASAVPHSPSGIVHVQPVAIAYTRIHGMVMGRYHRPVASWPGDIGLMPHLLGVLKTGALDVDVHFGPAVDYDATSKRKEVSAVVEHRIRRMLDGHLRGRGEP